MRRLLCLFVVLSFLFVCISCVPTNKIDDLEERYDYIEDQYERLYGQFDDFQTEIGKIYNDMLSVGYYFDEHDYNDPDFIKTKKIVDKILEKYRELGF